MFKTTNKIIQPIKIHPAFSLVEVIIYVGLTGVILSGLVYFMISLVQVRTKAEVIAEVQTSQRQLYTQLNRLIKSSVSIDWMNSSLNVSLGNLVLTDVQGWSTEIKMDAENNLTIINNNIASPLTNNLVKVDRLIFKRLDDQTVKVEMNISYRARMSKNFDYQSSWQSVFRTIN